MYERMNNDKRPRKRNNEDPAAVARQPRGFSRKMRAFFPTANFQNHPVMTSVMHPTPLLPITTTTTEFYCKKNHHQFCSSLWCLKTHLSSYYEHHNNAVGVIGTLLLQLIFFRHTMFRRKGGQKGREGI
eukprot:scaffold3038_cov163-Amphora_coffeaeformis.AAC.10